MKAKGSMGTFGAEAGPPSHVRMGRQDEDS